MVLGKSFVFARFKSKEMSKYGYEQIVSIDSLQTVIDSLKIQLQNREIIANNKQIVIDSLKRTISNMSLNTNQRMMSFRDSLFKEITRRDKEILQFQFKIGFFDTCMVKLANRRLYEKFDKRSVDEAITYFDRINNSELKSELSIVQKLLRNYESAYREFQSILKQAQNDIERTSPFGVEEYKERYIRMIQTMPYYIQYYENDWNIRYLNKRIKEALNCLQTHSDKKYADFSSLID